MDRDGHHGWCKHRWIAIHRLGWIDRYIDR